MVDAETRGGRPCLEAMTVVQERHDRAQVDVAQVCVCGGREC